MITNLLRFSLYFAASLFVLLLTSDAHAARIQVDLTPLDGNNICGTPGFHDERLDALKKGPPRPLTKDEKIKRGYLTAEGVAAAPPIVGDTKSFRVLDDGGWITVLAELRNITTEAYVYVQIADRNADRVFFDGATGYITQADVDSVATEFTSIYTTNRSTFGNEIATGIDGDAHVTILLLDIDSDYADYVDHGDEWWLESWTAGYFYSIDMYPKGTYAGSNESKVIYIDTYPTIEHGSYDFGPPGVMDAVPTTTHDNDVGGILLNEGAEASYATIAHEFEHMIHYNHDPNEETWVDEGCAGFAQFINGYGHPAAVASFVSNPTDSLISWGRSIVDYGNTYLFMLYLYEQKGGTVMSDVVSEAANGTQGVENSLGGTITYVQLFKDWTVANYFDDAGMAAEYGYTNITMSSYSLGGGRAGIDPELDSGLGTVGAYAAEYQSIAYDSMPNLIFCSHVFAPIVVGLNGVTVVSGSIEELTPGVNAELTNFGGAGPESYSDIVLIAANTSTATAGYSYDLSDVALPGCPTSSSSDGGLVCFIATAAYDAPHEKKSYNAILDAILKIIYIK